MPAAPIPKIEARILDINLEPEVFWSIEPPMRLNLFMCVYEGSIRAKDVLERTQDIIGPAVLLFNGSGTVEIMAGKSGASLLYCEGEPLNEPVARMGPFVMNTKEEIIKAAEDYNAGRLAS